ncbi:MAG TPA: hypothetical protein VF796_22765, partial [Humisphaera sp.]
TAACRDDGRAAAEVRLWADAMAVDPRLATRARAKAIRAAAQAGCGLGADAAGLTDAIRATWREHARRWLWDELDAAERRVWTGEPIDATAGRTAVAAARLGVKPLQDPGRLVRLPSDERAAWEALFARADRIAAAGTTRPATGPAAAR